jgi:hypothetical protein
MGSPDPIVQIEADAVSGYTDQVMGDLRALLDLRIANLVDAGLPLPDPNALVAAMAAGIPDVPAEHPFAAALGPSYSSASVMRLLRIPSKQALDDRRRRWTVLAAKTDEGRWVYPAFQFDAEHARVHPGLAPVLRGLRGAPRWGAALWLVTGHPELDGQPPRQAAELGTADPQLLTRLAEHYAAAAANYVT